MDKVMSIRLNALDVSFLEEARLIIKDTTNLEVNDSLIMKTALDFYVKSLRRDPDLVKC